MESDAVTTQQNTDPNATVNKFIEINSKSITQCVDYIWDDFTKQVNDSNYKAGSITVKINSHGYTIDHHNEIMRRLNEKIDGKIRMDFCNARRDLESKYCFTFKAYK